MPRRSIVRSDKRGEKAVDEPPRRSKVRVSLVGFGIFSAHGRWTGDLRGSGPAHGLARPRGGAPGPGGAGRGTQAGLTLGAKLSNAPYQLWGVAVSAGEPEKIERARKVANDAAVLLDSPTRVERDDLFTDQGFIGEGYGIATAEGLEAIKLVADTEAILLDPAYTSKAMVGTIETICRGGVREGATAVFIHTGGAFGLMARRDLF